jgi:hypothetical protein
LFLFKLNRMNKIYLLRYCPGLFSIFFSITASGQIPADTLLQKLLGRWEVVAYSEQGVQVDKKAPPLPQALEVYEHVRRQRAEQWYGYHEYTEMSRRENRDFQQWQERDSSMEVRRLAEAIEMPYYAVFFADSTISIYNKEATTSRIFFPEARHYSFAPSFMSIDIFNPGGFGVQWKAQVLQLSSDRMTLFLPEEAEIVELVKTMFSLP